MSDKAKLSQRINAVTRTLSPLVMSSLDKIDIITNAMVLRGFGKNRKRTWYMSRPMKAADWAAIALTVLLLAVTIISRYVFGVKFYYPF